MSAVLANIMETNLYPFMLHHVIKWQHARYNVANFHKFVAYS